MSKITKKGPIIDPGKCRCCGLFKKCRVLNAEYDHLGQTETYSDMIMDCFGLLLCNMDGEETERCVCATCVVRLRDACALRQQVLRCEELMLQAMHSQKSTVKVKIEVKDEGSAGGGGETAAEEGGGLDSGDDDVRDDAVPSDDDTPADVTPAPRDVTRRRAKPRARTRPDGVKKEVITKMKKFEHMLKMKLKPDAAPAPPKPPKSTPAETVTQKPAIRKMCDEDMVHQNQVQLVECSFLCPFRNRISNYYCYYCRAIFTDPQELRQHTLTHDPRFFEAAMESKRLPKVDITRIDCRLCPEKIEDLKTLKRHLADVHKKIIYPVEGEFVTFKLAMDNMSCLECGAQHPFIDKLIEHMTDHFGKYVCDTCGACFIEEASLVQHMRRHRRADEDFPCEVCGKNLKSNYSRTLHIATVHEKRPVVNCYKCEASFLSYAQRNRHLINVHGDRRKFPCGQCEKVFDVRKTLMEHLRKYHLQGYRHYCDTCDQRFFTPSELKEHKSSHTGEHNYCCDICDKSYPRRQSLLDHIRKHTRRLKCDYCSITFGQNASLKIHVKTHHPEQVKPQYAMDPQGFLPI